MKTKLALAITAALAGIVAAPTVAQAHHSFSMFDHDVEKVIEGTVNRWGYNSPHTLLFVKDAEGTQWVFEGAAPPSVFGRTPAMSGTTFTEGQHVFVVFCPLRDGRNGGGVGLVIADDGTVYNPADGGCSGPGQKTDKWPGWIESGYRSKEEAEAAEPATASN